MQRSEFTVPELLLLLTVIAVTVGVTVPLVRISLASMESSTLLRTAE